MRGSRVVALVAVSFSLGALGPAPALAQQDASTQAAAQALFDQARQLMADGKYAEACPKLVESQRLDPGAGTLLNLGQCYEKNGQTASAWVTFKDAAAAAELKHRADWSQRARERSQALEPLLSKLTIDVPAEERGIGIQVRRDGVEVGMAVWGAPIPVDPGDHAIEATAPAKKRWTTTVNVGPKADQAHVTVAVLEDEPVPSAVAAAPTPVAAAPPPVAPLPPPQTPPAEPAASGSSQRTAGLVVGGVGIVGVALGSVFGVIAAGKASDSKTLCPSAPNCTSAAGVQDNSDAKSSATVSTIAMIVGGAAVATGAVLYFTAPKGRSSGAALNVGPAVGPGQVGLRLGGAW
jgi:serine/threonine-protein kinase